MHVHRQVSCLKRLFTAEFRGTAIYAAAGPAPGAEGGDAGFGGPGEGFTAGDAGDTGSDEDVIDAEIVDEDDK